MSQPKRKDDSEKLQKEENRKETVSKQEAADSEPKKNKKTKKTAKSAKDQPVKEKTSEKEKSGKEKAAGKDAEPKKKKTAEKKTETVKQAAPEKKTAPKKEPLSKEESGRRMMDILLSLVLLGGIGIGAYYVVSSASPIDQTTTYVTESTTEATTAPTEESKTIYQSEQFENTAVHSGDLILVNNWTEYLGTEDDVISLYEKKLEADCHSFSVRDGNLLVREVVAEQLIAMFDDFYSETYDDNIVVLSGYRSKERQQELYDEDLAATGQTYSERVAKAGYSEHQTGYCVDLDLVGDDAEYDGTGVYTWIDEHCYEYGFILRYTEAKSPITEIQYEPWHYRYVGRPHAYYMTSGNLCLEEYMDLLKDYPYEGEHLMITDSDGKIYEVYYVAMDAGYDTTMVPVPGDLEYTVSGNNSDGFIVTVDTGEMGDPPILPTESTTDPEEGSDSAEDTDSGEDTESSDTEEDAEAEE